MNNDVKIQMIDYLNFMESSGKISIREKERLRKSLENTQKIDKKIPLTLLTRKQVADLLQVSTRTVDRMCEQGLLKFHRLGPRYIRFDMEDILMAVNQH